MSKVDPLLSPGTDGKALRRMDSAKKVNLFRANSKYQFDEASGAYLPTKAERAREHAILLRHNTTKTFRTESLMDVISPKEDTVAEAPKEELTNTFQTSVNATLALVGAGVLGIPHVFGQAGILMGAIMLGLCGVTMVTAVLIGNICEELVPIAESLQVPKASRDWPFMGFSAFGDAGRGFAGIIFVVELWALLVTYLICNGSNLVELFKNFDIHVSKEKWILFSGVVSFLLLLPSQKVLSYFSIFGILSTVAATACLIWSGFSQPTWAIQEEEMNWLDFSAAPSAIGILQFCFVAHSAFPCIYRNMEKPQNYKKSMSIAFCFAGAFYLMFGVLGYVFWGSQAKDIALHNIGKDYHGKEIPGLWLCRVIPLACFVINLQTSFPVYATGLLAATESWIGIAGKGVLIETVWKLFFMGITACLAAFACDMFRPVQSLTGCICATCTCLLMPIAFAWQLCGMSGIGKCLAVLGIIYSVWIAVSGTLENINDMTKS